MKLKEIVGGRNLFDSIVFYPIMQVATMLI